MATNVKSAVGYILVKYYITGDRCIDFSECQRIDYASDVSDSDAGYRNLRAPNLRDFKKYKLYVFSLDDLLKLSEFVRQNELSAIVIYIIH